MNTAGKFYLGTSGLLLPYKNKSFYPEALQGQSRLFVYGQLFNSIEINKSFYTIPQAHTVQRWTDNVPPQFKFTFKLWKGITHNKSFSFDPVDVALFMTRIKPAAEKAGCILLQLPPSAKFNSFAILEMLLNTIQEQNQNGCWKVAVEFRNQTWYREETYHMLESKNCSIVLHDKAEAQSIFDDLGSSTVYLRFHGPDGNYRGEYDDGFLAEYAGYIKDWLVDGKDVFIYFNNTMGAALQNLITLRNYISNP
jgi:uncharacterized protein YecE (DUF72 family)